MARLPAEFSDLETWVNDWALATHNERWRKRAASTREELEAFYAALEPRVAEILAYADRFPLGALPADAAHAYHLALMLAEVAPNVELYRGSPKVPHSFEESRFIAVHGDRRE